MRLPAPRLAREENVRTRFQYRERLSLGHSDTISEMLTAVQPIPDFRERVPEHVTDSCSDDDDRNGRSEIKRSYDNGHTDHVCPHTEINKRLRPPDCNENCPDEMQAAHKLTQGEPGLLGIKVIHTNNVIRLIHS